MLLKSLINIPTFIAGDQTLLKEVIHPKNDSLDLPYSLAHASIAAGQSSLPHRLSGDELYIFISGKGCIFIDEEKREVRSGDIVLVPKHTAQYVKNTGSHDLVFYCIVSPPWSEEGEVVL